MKLETKRKILIFVSKILRYTPSKDKPPFILLEYEKVVIVQSQQMFPAKELQMLSLDQLKYHAQLNLMSELDAAGVIVYETRSDMTSGYDMKIFEARIRIVKP